MIFLIKNAKAQLIFGAEHTKFSPEKEY